MTVTVKLLEEQNLRVYQLVPGQAYKPTQSKSSVVFGVKPHKIELAGKQVTVYGASVDGLLWHALDTIERFTPINVTIEETV